MNTANEAPKKLNKTLFVTVVAAIGSQKRDDLEELIKIDIVYHELLNFFLGGFRPFPADLIFLLVH